MKQQSLNFFKSGLKTDLTYSFTKEIIQITKKTVNLPDLLKDLTNPPIYYTGP